MTTDEWQQVSRTLDFILAQKKESGAGQAIRGEPEKPKQKKRKPKPEPQAEQLRMF